MQWRTGVRARPIATIRRAIAEFECNPSKSVAWLRMNPGQLLSISIF
jgi:hypothetical protein